MFRKFEMNIKKETLHRCLANNSETIDLLYEVYSSTNYDSKDEKKQIDEVYKERLEVALATA